MLNPIPNVTNVKTELDVYIGKLLNNRYLIRDLIGKGGMGRVYLAEDVAKGGMPVAVKILSLSLGSQQMTQRFAREIFIGAQLGRKSKNIVRMFSYGVTEENIPYYVMEYLQGKNLKRILKTQTFSITKVLDISNQICLGLQCAHQGIILKGENYPIVHRDIKPENIFIIEDGKKEPLVKILDFGIAKFLTERSGMTLTDSFIGSLPYCSPEHMEGRKLLDVRSDIYSLGILMFEMFTGKHPFHTTSNSFGIWYQAHHFQAPPAFAEVNSQVVVPDQLQKLVMRCLAKEVSDRPQNIKEILEILEQVKSEVAIASNSSTERVESNPILQIVPLTSFTEKECLQKSWPKNRPIATIGFPSLLHTLQGTVPTFWAMLPQQEINKFFKKSHGTEFIAKINVYPMILWSTLLYNTQNSQAKWLSCFLDMKDNKGQKILRSLAETGFYHLLFFPLEEPHKCTKVMTLTLNANQRQQLLDWLGSSQNANEFISAKQAKIILKADYERLKSSILRKMVANLPKNDDNLKSKIMKLFYTFFQMILRR
ncbi:serine/threonine protein kinase [Tolypothrix tenuis PCC 7101]|uniref:non-specific serine/threonine protein kinase n=1 Tax=Tolypothrix tenuis PCC 7101 TaxID=231146 RepID=A0A1Z4MS53_9CYAN|nr:serine/threonine protein kinase [Aulosira sp. FACHB-113]BAY96316.1 serine/threonine protein kinase [Tolypothrix tenuis PCC 7101]BAZ73177.1 serine/threonine protein kinase [Aulosira laxa NIES-50]